MDNFIQRASGTLSKEECDAVIDFFESCSKDHDRVDSRAKIVSQIALDVRLLPNDSALTPVAGKLRDMCGKYIEKYPFLTRIESWKIDICLKIQKYNPHEGYFNLHCENDGKIFDGYDKRLIAFMVYLNDVTDGGETEFVTQGVKFQPRCGDILMWPAYWTHPHRGIPSPSQVKYIITGWYIFDD
tara:strand:- start:49 stop:603 length:555 start_codon:yes stop_codon:yes gene_type:complete